MAGISSIQPAEAALAEAIGGGGPTAITIGHSAAAPVFDPTWQAPSLGRRQPTWPASVMLRAGGVGPFTRLALPALPNAAHGDEAASSARINLLKAMTGARHDVAFGADDSVSFKSRNGDCDFHVTLRLVHGQVTDVEVRDTANPPAVLSDLVLRAARAQRMLACTDGLLALPRGRLDNDLRVMACILDEAARTLVERGIDPMTDPRVDDVLQEVVPQALGVLSQRPLIAPVLDRIRSRFQPEASATFTALRDGFEAVDELRGIEPRHRWRLFVDPAIVQAVEAAGLEASHPVMVFLLDGSQAGYALHYARGLCDALAHKDEPLDLARLQAIALATCDQHALCADVSSSLTCTAAGRADLADLVDLARMPPYNVDLLLQRPDLHLEALFLAGQPRRFTWMVSGTTQRDLSTSQCIELLTPDATEVPVRLRFRREAPIGGLELLLTHLLADRQERESASPSGGASDASSDAVEGNGSSAPERRSTPRSPALVHVHASGYRFYSALMLVHPHADGTGRLGSTLLNVHLVRSGQGLTALHDLSATDGGSVEEGCARIAQGQALVASWGKAPGGDVP